MFSNNKGTDVLPIAEAGKPLTGQQGVYASAVLDRNTNEIVLKLVNTTNARQVKSITLQTGKKVKPDARLTVLRSDRLDAVNEVDKPEAVKPVEATLMLKGKSLEMAMEPYSLNVVRVKLQ
jgi:alpha-L-arabinofuranosidase